MAIDLRLSLLNLIGLLFSIKFDRFHLDAHPSPIVDQISLTYTTKTRMARGNIFMQSNFNSLTMSNHGTVDQKTIHTTTASRLSLMIE